MGKLTNLNNLDKLSKALDARYKELIDEEKARAIAEEQALQTEINTTKEMLGGRSIIYISQSEYDSLSEEEKNNSSVTYFVTDAVDLSHEHENKEFLDNLAARNIAIGNKSQSFDGVNDLVYTIEDMGVAPVEHNHDDMYYTETEIDGKIEDINESINEQVAGLQASVANKADQSYVDEKLEVVDALTLNGYSIWVGTTTELEAIETRDPNTIYFEIGDDESGDEVVQVDIVNNILQLTADKYQKTNMVDGTEIVFPSVNKFTEIHLYFTGNTDMNLTFPDCKWRVEPNIEEGISYEMIATYNTIEWLVNVIAYS